MSSTPRIKILRGKDALGIIQGKWSQRISTPLEVTSAIRVHKIFYFKSKKMVFDMDGFISSAIKVRDSIVVMDAAVDEVLGILVHNVFGEDAGKKICEEALQLV